MNQSGGKFEKMIILKKIVSPLPLWRYYLYLKQYLMFSTLFKIVSYFHNHNLKVSYCQHVDTFQNINNVAWLSNFQDLVTIFLFQPSLHGCHVRTVEGINLEIILSGYDHFCKIRLCGVAY